MRLKWVWGIAIAGVLVGSAIYLVAASSGPSSSGTVASSGTSASLGSSASSSAVASSNGSTPVTTQQTTSVPADQIISGGPPPDGIPSIDRPKFLNASQATFLSDSDRVIGLYNNGVAKAYPLLIMVWHEIVNDEVGGKPLAITYCPLCYSTSAYVREISGKPVTFGTSGRLYNNNLVMYDRLTKSLWSEMWGQAISGSLTGTRLERFPHDVVSWGEWKTLYPNTLVLSTDTGYNRPYGSDPYGGYYTDSEILFPLSHTDGRLPVKTIIIGLPINGSTKAYPQDSLKAGVLEDSVGQQKVVLFVATNGFARVFNPFVGGKELNFEYSNGNFVDTETHTTWNFSGVATAGPMKGTVLFRYPTETAFWFAWAAFFPDTLLYSGA